MPESSWSPVSVTTTAGLSNSYQHMNCQYNEMLPSAISLCTLQDMISKEIMVEFGQICQPAMAIGFVPGEEQTTLRIYAENFILAI
jgi:hypothetical protein